MPLDKRGVFIRVYPKNSLFTASLPGVFLCFAHFHFIISLSFFMQIIALLVVFFGEFLAITSEIFFSKGKYMYAMIFLMFIAGCLLLVGYYLAYKHMNSLWPIYIATITAILILEPIIIYVITGETPGLGARIGFVLGALGCFAALGIS